MGNHNTDTVPRAATGDDQQNDRCCFTKFNPPSVAKFDLTSRCPVDLRRSAGRSVGSCLADWERAGGGQSAGATTSLIIDEKLFVVINGRSALWRAWGG